MRRHAPALLCAVALAASIAASSRPPAQAGPLRFSITLPHGAGGAPIDGRLLVIVSRVEGTEPRFQVGDGPSGQPVFGVDVEGWTPGTAATVDGSVPGFPLDSITDIPAGTYTVQALLHTYETFREVDYGDRAEHCWNGDHTRPNALSRLRYHQMFIPKAVERMLKTAPPGADVTSWRY